MERNNKGDRDMKIKHQIRLFYEREKELMCLLAQLNTTPGSDVKEDGKVNDDGALNNGAEDKEDSLDFLDAFCRDYWSKSKLMEWEKAKVSTGPATATPTNTVTAGDSWKAQEDGAERPEVEEENGEDDDDTGKDGERSKGTSRSIMRWHRESWRKLRDRGTTKGNQRKVDGTGKASDGKDEFQVKVGESQGSG